MRLLVSARGLLLTAGRLATMAATLSSSTAHVTIHGARDDGDGNSGDRVNRPPTPTAPLRIPVIVGRGDSNEWREVRGVVFDMDGTLTVPILDFAEMKRRLNIPLSSDILVTVRGMSADDRTRSMAIIEGMEEEANRSIRLQPGAVDVLHFLAVRGMPRALITRNSDRSVRVFLEHVSQLCASEPERYRMFTREPLFSQVITREFQPCKPDPAPILHICRMWSVDPTNVVMVGDDRVDMLCGRAAGAVTVLLANDNNSVGHSENADHIVSCLHNFIPLLMSEIPAAP